ncbi:thermonuclease family protein [Candidatus Gottesmanbacteria bacterium]|nr:thermonuclease family protein [Candidatus Gottesmanbacteria bacterium]
MEKRRPLVHQEELLKAQEEAKKKKLGIWAKQSLYFML